MTGNPDSALTDVHQTLSYSAVKVGRKILLLGLLCLGLGAAIYTLDPPKLASYDGIMLTLTFGIGTAATLYGLDRFVRPKPLVAMSPAGLRLHIEWVKNVLIPWREIRGIETTDIAGRVRGHWITFSGVTVVLVSRAFYDRHIHIRSWLMRGPGWDFNFIPKGDMVQVALHHEALPTAQELRAAVEARWHAFRDAKPVTTSVPRVRTQGAA